MKTGISFFQLALSPLVSVQLLRTDAPVSGGAARKGEGKVNSLIGMSTIPHTYLAAKPWELQLKSDTFLRGENSQAVKSTIYCQLQYLISIFWPWVSQYFSSTVTTLSPLFPYYFFLVARSGVAQCYDLIPLFIHIGISCIKYGPLIVPEIRNRSWVSSRLSKTESVCKWRVGSVPPTPPPVPHLRSEVGLVLGFTSLKSTGVYAVLWQWAEPLPGSSLSPESNPFHRSHKVLLTFKIHSSGFIHWSEVVRAPKTNRGLRSGISDGQVPRTHHAGLIQ